jgi:hypothetical protein
MVTVPYQNVRSKALGEDQLEVFIDKFDSKNASLIRSARKTLRKRLPTANELVYDNYNFFVIGYCSTERPSDCIVSIAAAANGVGLSLRQGDHCLWRREFRFCASGVVDDFNSSSTPRLLGMDDRSSQVGSTGCE